MYKSKCGLTVYETFEELLNAPINCVYETPEYFFIKREPEDYYDNSMWKVRKSDLSIKCIYYTGFMCEYQRYATELNVQEFLKRMRKSS